jgi:hypothetical protein
MKADHPRKSFLLILRFCCSYTVFELLSLGFLAYTGFIIRDIEPGTHSDSISAASL